MIFNINQSLIPFRCHKQNFSIARHLVITSGINFSGSDMSVIACISNDGGKPYVCKARTKWLLALEAE